MTDRRRSVLVVTSAPDERTSTASLRVVVDELARRDDVDVAVWLLRPGPNREQWSDALVVDDLRTWTPARLLDRIGGSRLASGLRGLRLRSWYRAVAPDVVVLDDGLGERVLVGGSAHPVVVSRLNETAPDDAVLEPEPTRRPDIVLDPRAAAGPDELGSPYFRHYDAALEAVDPQWRHRARARLSVQLPADAPVVVGWGDEGWLDGPDLFVRALWALEHRHGVRAHGLWLGLGADPHEADRLRAEAARCGIEERFHLEPADDEALRCCGDAVLLPYRAAGEPTEVLAAVVSGLVVVTFPTVTVVDESVVVVDDLDVDAAADALARALATDRAVLADAAFRRLTVEPWVDRLLAAVDGVGR